MYIHNSTLGCHGNLKSSNCVVTSRWVLQVTDFGLIELRQLAAMDNEEEHQTYRSKYSNNFLIFLFILLTDIIDMLWKAPELLRYPDRFPKGTPKGDVYAFGLILYEILGRRGPFGPLNSEPKGKLTLNLQQFSNNCIFLTDIVLAVKNPTACQPLMRPDVDLLYDSEIGCDGYVLEVMQECWAESPENRPDFSSIRSKLKRMRDGK